MPGAAAHSCYTAPAEANQYDHQCRQHTETAFTMSQPTTSASHAYEQLLLTHSCIL